MENKKLKKNTGIWMDHAQAVLINMEEEIPVMNTIDSALESNVRIPGESGDGTQWGSNRSANNEFNKHEKDRNDLKSYFNELAEALQDYDEILIFGPTTAPNEFYNYLLKDKQFEGKVIHVKQEGYLTDNQRTEYVRNFFK